MGLIVSQGCRAQAEEPWPTCCTCMQCTNALPMLPAGEQSHRLGVLLRVGTGVCLLACSTAGEARSLSPLALSSVLNKASRGGMRINKHAMPTIFQCGFGWQGQCILMHSHNAAMMPGRQEELAGISRTLCKTEGICLHAPGLSHVLAVQHLAMQDWGRAL